MADMAATSHSLWIATVAALLLPVAMLWLADRESHGPKLRTWTAIAFTGAAAWAILPMHQGTSYFGAAMLLDLAGGCATILRPAGRRQFTIGAIFALMSAYNLGAVLGGAQVATWEWWCMQAASGWLQIAILIEWTGQDAGKAILSGLRNWWPKHHPSEAARRTGQ